MDPLLATALQALDITEPPQRMSPDVWRTEGWKIKTAEGAAITPTVRLRRWIPCDGAGGGSPGDSRWRRRRG